MNLNVRRAAHSDVPTLIAFNAAMAWETENKTLDPTILRQGVEAIFDDLHKGAYFIAEVGSKIAGQLMITTEWSDWRNGTFWWIQSVYVAPEFRRRGVYRRLHDHIFKLARQDRGVCGLRLYVDKGNQPAKATYDDLGMKPTHYDFYEVDFSHSL